MTAPGNRRKGSLGRGNPTTRIDERELPIAAELPLLAELRAREQASSSVVETWFCRNPGCLEWTPKGSADAGRCLRCQTPRPTLPRRV